MKQQDWISVEVALPVTNSEHGESKSVLTFDKERYEYAVCWYNSNTRQWFVYHHIAPSTPVSVTHWMPLPELPDSI